MSEVLTVIKNYTAGNHKYSFMGTDDVPTHVHIDNFKTKKNSVIVPINDLAVIAGMCVAAEHNGWVPTQNAEDE